MSHKNTEKNLVGQPIFKQILQFIPRNKFDLLVNKHQSDRYYKTFDCNVSEINNFHIGDIPRMF